MDPRPSQISSSSNSVTAYEILFFICMLGWSLVIYLNALGAAVWLTLISGQRSLALWPVSKAGPVQFGVQFRANVYNFEQCVQWIVTHSIWAMCTMLWAILYINLPQYWSIVTICKYNLIILWAILSNTVNNIGDNIDLYDEQFPEILGELFRCIYC